MKSIIEQASSILKAIEKAWNQAEKPKEFSIKIFEQEERNFFGMSTKPAKVGIFFGGDKTMTHEKSAPRPQQKIKECRPASSKMSPVIEEKEKTQPVKPREHSKLEKVQGADIAPQSERSYERTRRIPITWNDAMITTAHNWLKQTLSLMGLPSTDCHVEVAGKNLKLTFNKPLIADPMQEKQLFRSFAHLIMSSLRNQYKQEIKNLKVVLIRPE